MDQAAFSSRKYLFVRLLVLYHIVILPIILLGLYLYTWSYNNAREEISRHTSIQLNSYLENLNREMEWMEGQQYDLLQENDLRKIALTWDTMDIVEKKSSLNYFVNRLTSIKNTSAYIKDIYIHIPTINKTLSALHAVQDFDQSKYAFNFNNRAKYQPISLLDKTLSLIVANMSRDIDGEPIYSVEIALDDKKLEQSLESINMYEESEIFLLSDDGDMLWSSNEISPDFLQKYLNIILEGQDDNSNIITIEGDKYHFDHAYSEQRGVFIVSYLPEDMVKRPLSIFKNWFWVFSIFTVVAIVIYSYFTYTLVHRPLLLLIDGFKRMENGRLDTPIEHEKEDEFGFLYNRYNKMLAKLKLLIDRDYKQTLMVQKAELKQLQSQINPHFLYNSFFILNSLAKTEDTERIELFTNMLGEYFKFITRSEKNLVPLVEEIRHARMYTEIQNMRFSRRITVKFDELPKELEQIKVPKLIVQPIIENAYKYSLERLSDHGVLSVSFDKRGHEVAIVVEDNGGTISDDEIAALKRRVADIEQEQELTGLVNIHRRIVLTYEKGSGLFLTRSALNGLKVKVRIILKESYKDV
ncbi:two-component system, sensor histidine kinase YesM [Evansella caseinilytica]|uniref:Two-component system, sensor histidine kinase YesM n=1 Tax=Evansella caseinilytica TaxID=1503961 RepID=A0A1H3NTN5_9BACI|nr:histidine kinase [Evansella caseinilytica]SDY92287.1 two-component system, sensor histidine kinase YesM [Evansella caseinilytica]